MGFHFPMEPARETSGGLREAELLECVHPHAPRDAERVELRRISTGKFNASYFVILHRLRGKPALEWVLRVAPPDTDTYLFYERGMMRQEPGLHALLRNKTEVPVPKILHFDETRRTINRDWMLMERLPGTPLTHAQGIDATQALRDTGRWLREVHRLSDARHGYLGAHRPMTPQARWIEAFVLMWGKLLDDVVATGHYSAADRTRLVDLLDVHRPAFTYDGPGRLLHMDVWGQNILVDGEGRVTGLVDWDRALWGDPEIEFAVLDYCGISQPAFWEGYGTARDTSPVARVRGAFYLLYELQKYIVIRHGRGKDPARAAQFKQQAFELIEKTFPR